MKRIPGQSIRGDAVVAGTFGIPLYPGRDPPSVTEQQINELRQLGWSECEIVEAQGVMELFTTFNKFLDSLSVEIDF